MARNRLITILAILLLLAAPPVFAQPDITWVTVEGFAAAGQGSKEEARSRALEDALRKAREKVIGSSVSVEALAVNFKLSGGLVAAIPYLNIVEKTIVEEGMTAAEGGVSATRYRVLVKAGIAEVIEGVDPAFKVESSLNRSAFTEGDEMKIQIKATQDCDVSVFLITGEGKVIRLLPNRFKSVLFLKGGEVFTFPSEEDRRVGLKLITNLDDNKTAQEAIYVLALKNPGTYDPSRFKEGLYGVYDGNTAFLNELAKDISGIPLQGRAEKLIQYQINRKDKGGMR